MTEMYQPAAAAAAAAKTSANKKKTASAVVAIPAPARKIALYYLDTRNTSVVAYYQDDGVGYAEVALYVNGVVPKGTYRFTVAKDRMSVLWQRAIHKRCFDKKLLQGIMKDKYSSSHSHVIAYNNVLQEMHLKRLTPDASGLYWGAPQVIRLSKKVTGSHIELVHPYPTKVKVQGATQYNTLVHCWEMLARQRIKASAPTHYRVINLFGLQSSQESNDNLQEPPYSPPKRSRNTDAHVVTSRRRSQNAYINNEANVNDERDLDADYDGGGKHRYHDERGFLLIYLLLSHIVTFSLPCINIISSSIALLTLRKPQNSVTCYTTPSASLTNFPLHSLRVGWRNFFSSCAVVSVFGSGRK
jgi:hypothetical protein